MLALAQVNFGDLVRVWRRNYDVYIRLWKTELIAPLFEPIFSIIGFGWGVGSLVAGRVMEVPYLTFVGAGLLAFTALVRALFECTYGSYFRMVYQSTFDAILSTPVEVESLAAGEIVWGATKALLDGIFVLGVLACFGAILSPFGLLIPLIIALGALWMAALSLWVTSRISDINEYNFFLAFVFSYLWISGAYFPLERLHWTVQVIARVVPVTGAIDVSRNLMIGRLDWSDAVEVGYLIAATLIACEMALRSLRRR
ncbi:MAG: ABC transporter permease, partial [Acidobacteriota bacterium]